MKSNKKNVGLRYYTKNLMQHPDVNPEDKLKNIKRLIDKRTKPIKEERDELVQEFITKPAAAEASKEVRKMLNMLNPVQQQRDLVRMINKYANGEEPSSDYDYEEEQEHYYIPNPALKRKELLSKSISNWRKVLTEDYDFSNLAEKHHADPSSLTNEEETRLKGYIDRERKYAQGWYNNLALNEQNKEIATNALRNWKEYTKSPQGQMNLMLKKEQMFHPGAKSINIEKLSEFDKPVYDKIVSDMQDPNKAYKPQSISAKPRNFFMHDVDPDAFLSDAIDRGNVFLDEGDNPLPVDAMTNKQLEERMDIVPSEEESEYNAAMDKITHLNETINIYNRAYNALEEYVKDAEDDDYHSALELLSESFESLKRLRETCIAFAETPPMKKLFDTLLFHFDNIDQLTNQAKVYGVNKGMMHQLVRDYNAIHSSLKQHAPEILDQLQTYVDMTNDQKAVENQIKRLRSPEAETPVYQEPAED